MKAISIAVVMILSLDAFPICTSPISRTNINQGQIPTSIKYNMDFDVLYGAANSLNGSCFLDTSIQTKQFANSSITSDKIADGSITANKFASGLIPTLGRLVRVRAYMTNGKWAKQPETEYILVHVVGGGGGAGVVAYDGGTSSFGSHCIAYGGTNCTTSPSSAPCVTTAAPGGGAANGDINLQGGPGEMALDGSSGNVISGTGGYSFFGKFGRGAFGPNYDGGGGAGGYCIKLINKTALADNEDVTVGAGGLGTLGTSTAPGNSGIVLVYEYEK